MIFTETKLKGAYLIEPEAIEDERGFFARSFCQKEFKEHGIDFSMRGMHYQAKPYEEAKIVSCPQGAIYDVIIDLRPDSPTYCQWVAVNVPRTLEVRGTCVIYYLRKIEKFVRLSLKLLLNLEVYPHECPGNRKRFGSLRIPVMSQEY